MLWHRGRLYTNSFVVSIPHYTFFSLHMLKSSVDVASCCFHFSTFEVGPNGTIVVKTPKKETHKKTPKRRSPYNSNYICRNSHFFVHFSIFEVLVGYIVPKYRSSIKYQWEMVGQILLHTYMAQDGIDLFEG